MLFRHFIRGFVDGNGYIADVYKSKRKYRVHILSLASTLSLCETVAHIFKNSCGVHCSIEQTKHSPSIYQMRVGGRLQVIKVLHYLYDDATIALARKWAIARKIVDDKFIDHRFNQISAA